MRRVTFLYPLLIKCITIPRTLIFLYFEPYLSKDTEIRDFVVRISLITRGSKCQYILWTYVTTVVCDPEIAGTT
jgi:hypothetical protein